MTATDDRLRILYLEPYESGSHAAFTRALTLGVDADWTVVTLPGRHWKWRMRGSAAWATLARPDALGAGYDLVFASAYLPLAELGGLVPSLARVPKLLYFHENQLAYPVRAEHSGERDDHFGFTQLVAALAADRCVFNSAWNRASFLAAGRALLRRLPDAVPDGWIERLDERSEVLPLPLDLPDVEAGQLADVPPGPGRADGPVLLWSHRREFDKAPETFFGALRRLVARDVPFRVVLLGERFGTEPAVFADARSWLGGRLVHDGFATSRADYVELVLGAQIAVSTAIHEFFGVSVLEAVHLGVRPVVPDRLAYPEHLPARFRYVEPDVDSLADTLERLCVRWTEGRTDLRADRRGLVAPYRAASVLPRYLELFERVATRRRS